MSLSKAQIEKLAQVRLDESLRLLADFPAGAYYLGGYAIELALKAVVAKKFEANAIPDRKFVQQVYTHRLDDLIELAGLEGYLEQEGADFLQNWEIVSRWSEGSRYEIIGQEIAQPFVEAVSNTDHGIFLWIKTHW